MERYYVGRRPQRGTEVYVVTAVDVKRLRHHGYRSGSPFDWGAISDGALELAFALLAHATESRPPDAVCEAFRGDVLARLDRPGFVLAYGDIALWLLVASGAFIRGDACQLPQPGSIRRVVRWLGSRFGRR